MTDADLTRRARVEAWNGWIDDHRGHGSVTRELMAAWDAAWTAASAALSAELAEAKAENERLRATYGLDRDDKHPCIRVEAYLRLKADRDAARAEVERLRAVSAAQPYETERELAAALDAAHAETEQYRRNEVTLTNELSRAHQDAAEFCGQRDEARAALAALREQYRDLATYRTTHTNLGLCPEGPDDPARDPDCPVCAALGAAPSETEEGR